MFCLGMNIYCEDSDQKRLLLDNLRFWARDAGSQGIANLFWYRRFDARGPHVFAVFGGDPCLRQFFEPRVSAFLRECHGGGLAAADIQRRHRRCRGLTLCAPDHEPGFAQMKSCVAFELGPGDYPLSLTTQLECKAIFWQCVDSLTFWLLDQVKRGTGPSAAVACCCGIEISLRCCGMPMQDFWRSHAHKLLPVLARREMNSDKAKDWLQLALSEHNSRVLSRLWNQIDRQIETGVETMKSLVNAVILDRQITSWDGKLAILIETLDLIFHQLWLPQSVQTVIILYAWRQSMG
jgi:hypothetical protein